MRDQFLAKLQRKKRHLSDTQHRTSRPEPACRPRPSSSKLRRMSLAEIAAWFTQNPDLGEILDRKRGGQRPPVFISNHEDSFQGSIAATARPRSRRTTSRSSPTSSRATATPSRL